MRRIVGGCFVLLFLAACVSTTTAPPQVRAELAPTGTLRAGINYANTVIATKDPATGELRGVSVDLMRELARRLNVPVELTGFDFSGKLTEALNAGALDIGGIAGGAGSGREGTLDFTAGYVQIETTYMVAPASSIKTTAEVDRDGVRVGVADKSAFQPFLARTLKSARLLTGPGNPTAFELLRSGQVDALAGLRHQLLEVAPKLPGSRVLAGHFLVVEQTLAIPKGREAGLRYLREFIEEMKASGFISRSLEKSGNAHVPVSPPAAVK